MDTIYNGWLARRLHQLFELSLFFKGFFAVVELMSGLVLLGIGPHRFIAIFNWFTDNDLVEQPTDPLAQTVLTVAHGLSPETAHFYAIYLFGHGIIKLVMVLMLARRALWAYPVAVLVLAGFVSYQLYHYSVDPSFGLLVLSGLDLIMIGLVLREYWVLKSVVGLKT